MKVTYYMAFTCHTRPQSMSHVHITKATSQSRELTEHMHIYKSCTSHQIYYGVATVSRIDKIIGLFCKRAL